MNVRVEYDSTPIRHIAVQCPECEEWFNGRDIVNGDWLDELRFEHQIYWATFTCPVCGWEFGGLHNADKANIEEVSYPEVYDGCLERKEVWK